MMLFCKIETWKKCVEYPQKESNVKGKKKKDREWKRCSKVHTDKGAVSQCMRNSGPSRAQWTKDTKRVFTWDGPVNGKATHQKIATYLAIWRVQIQTIGYSKWAF